MAFDECVLAGILDPKKGLNGVIICQIFDLSMVRFANVSGLEVDANLLKFNEPMDPSVTLASSQQSTFTGRSAVKK